MTPPPDRPASELPTCFDPTVLASVAEEFECLPEELAANARRLQRLLEGQAAVGGVDGLVYEWRRTWAEDPVVRREPDRYFLDTSAQLWKEFASRLELPPGQLEALEALHARQAAVEQETDEGKHQLVVLRD